MAEPSDLKAIAALASACWRTEGSGRDILIEDLLSRLRDSAPDVTRIVASLLRARGDRIGRKLGEAVHAQLAEYAGDPFVIDPLMKVDYLILTVKPEELRACLRAFNIPAGVTATRLGRGLKAWTADVDGARFAIAMVGTAGNVESAIVLGGLCTLIESRGAVLLGMAGGVRGRVKLGDIVVAEEVLAYEFQRMKPSGPIFGPRSYGPAEKQIRNCTALDQDEPGWREPIRQDVRPHLVPWPVDETENADDGWEMRIHRGVILAGGRLIEDGSLPKMADNFHTRTLAAEMEGAGFAAACAEHAKPWLIIRGIADYGEPQRRKHWQFPATYAAARYLRAALRQDQLSLDP